MKDRVSIRQFLVDAYTDLYMYPRRLISRRKESGNYDLCAPNGTNPHLRMAAPQPQTDYAGISRRDSWWPKSHIASRRRFPLSFFPPGGMQTQPLTGRGHIIACAGPAASSLISSVKTISGGTPVDSLHAEFPDLTQPASIFTQISRLGNVQYRKMHKIYCMIRTHNSHYTLGILIRGGLYSIHFNISIASIRVTVQC
jgi:hypothetical protein